MKKKWKKWHLNFHRYAGLIVSTQALVWALGGLTIYFMDLSDLYINPPTQSLPSNIGLSLEKVSSQLASQKNIQGLSLKMINKTPYLIVKVKKSPNQLYDLTGKKHSPLSNELATSFAKSYYTGKGSLEHIELKPSSTGNYYSSQPIYKARFDDPQKTEVYVNASSGELLARRKAAWQIYNTLWEWHLMKYTPKPWINTALFLIFGLLNALIALSGLYLFFSLRRGKPSPS